MFALGVGHTGEEGFCKVVDVSEFEDGSVGDGVGGWGVREVGCWEVEDQAAWETEIGFCSEKVICC